MRLDDTAIPGIGETVAYLDLRPETIDEVAVAAIDKITAVKSRGAKAGGAAKTTAPVAKPPATPTLRAGSHQIEKHFTDLPFSLR